MTRRFITALGVWCLVAGLASIATAAESHADVESAHGDGVEEPSCHGESHEVGAAIAGRSNTLTEALLACGDRCTFGCVHGAIRAYFSSRLGHDGATTVAPDVAREILALCREDSTTLPGFFRGNCAHSVGHALNASAPSLGTAVGWCGLFGSDEMRFYCETGLFMDARREIRKTIAGKNGSFSRLADASVAFCAAEAFAPGACLRFVYPRADTLDEARELVGACAVLDRPSRSGCVYAAGYRSRHYLRRHPAATGEVCATASPSDRAACVAGVVLLKKDHRDREALSGVCDALADSGVRAACRDQASRFYYQLENPVILATLPD